MLAKYRLGKLRVANLSRTDKHFCLRTAITAGFEIGGESGTVTVDKAYRLVATGRTGIIKRIHTRNQKRGADWVGIVGPSHNDENDFRFILVRFILMEKN